MKKLFTVCVIIAGAISSLSAQTTTFQKLFSNGVFNLSGQIVQTSDGGYATTGTISDGAGSQSWLLKLDYAGQIMWSKTYNGTGNEMTGALLHTADSGYLIAGWTDSNPESTIKGYVIRTNSYGDTLWTRCYGMGSANFQSAAACSDGGFILAGSTAEFSSGTSSDLFVVKINSAGTLQWMKGIGQTGTTDDGTYVIQTNDLGYVICGSTSLGAGLNDVYLVKLNSSGDTLWTRTYGGITNDLAEYVIQTSDGGFMIAARTQSFGSGDYDILLIKTDANGALTWSRVYGDTDTDEATYIQETANHDFFVSGFQVNGSGSREILYFKTNNSGILLWAKGIGSTSDENIFRSYPTNDGGYISAGYLDDLSTTLYSYIIKIDSTGIAAGCNSITPVVNVSAVILTQGSGGVITPGYEVAKTYTTVSTITIYDSTLCEVIGISEIRADINFIIYPNPTTGLITLDLGDASNFNDIKIYNSIGALVGSENVKSVSGKVNIDLNKYGKGLLFLTSSNAENTFSVKVLVE